MIVNCSTIFCVQVVNIRNSAVGIGPETVTGENVTGSSLPRFQNEDD